MDPQLEQELNTIKAQTSTIKDETNKIEENTKGIREDTGKIGQVVSLIKEISGKMFSIDWDERKITISKTGTAKDDIGEKCSKNKKIILLGVVIFLIGLATYTVLWVLNLFHFNILNLFHTNILFTDSLFAKNGINTISKFGILCGIIIILSAILYLVGVLCFGNLRDFLQRDSLSLALVFSCAFLICVSTFIYLRKFDKTVDYIHTFYDKQDRKPKTKKNTKAKKEETNALEAEPEQTEKPPTEQSKKGEKSNSADSESVVHSQKTSIYFERDIKRELEYAYKDCKRRGAFYFKDDEDDIIAAPNNKDIAKKICGNYKSFLIDVIGNRFSAANNKLVSSYKLYQRIGHKNKDSIELSRLVYLHKYFRTLLCLFTDDCSVVEVNLKLIIPELTKTKLICKSKTNISECEAESLKGICEWVNDQCKPKNQTYQTYKNIYFPEFYYYFKTIEMIIESSSHLRVSSCKKLMRDFNFVLMNELSIEEFLKEFPEMKPEIENKKQELTVEQH